MIITFGEQQSRNEKAAENEECIDAEIPVRGSIGAGMKNEHAEQGEGAKPLTSMLKACSAYCPEGFMHIRRTCSGFAVTALTVAFLPLGCGASQDNYTVIEQQPHAAPVERRDSELSPEVRREVETCFKQHQGPWRQRKYSARYEANSNERGALADVKLQETTLDDELEHCVRKVIATMTIPEQTLRSRSSGPISGVNGCGASSADRWAVRSLKIRCCGDL